MRQVNVGKKWATQTSFIKRCTFKLYIELPRYIVLMACHSTTLIKQETSYIVDIKSNKFLQGVGVKNFGTRVFNFFEPEEISVRSKRILQCLICCHLTYLSSEGCYFMYSRHLSSVQRFHVKRIQCSCPCGLSNQVKIRFKRHNDPLWD